MRGVRLCRGIGVGKRYMLELGRYLLQTEYILFELGLGNMWLILMRIWLLTDKF